jgi:hypothetical protein
MSLGAVDAVEPAHVPLYVLFMIGGILAYSNGWLEAVSPSLVKTWGIITVVGICGIPLFVAAFGIASLGGGFTLVALLYSFWEAFLGIGICVCTRLVFKHRWNTRGGSKRPLPETCTPSTSFNSRSYSSFSGGSFKGVSSSRRAAAAPAVCPRWGARHRVLFLDQQLHRSQASVCGRGHLLTYACHHKKQDLDEKGSQSRQGGISP